MKKTWTATIALAVGLFGASTVFAAGETVPIETLQPAQKLEKPQLFGTGGKLILSDSPETFNGTGAFYRDRVQGEFRVFWHHQNTSSAAYSVGVAVTNTSSETVKLYTKGKGVGTNLYVDVAGQLALADFLTSEKNKTLAATLAPGQSYFVSASTDPEITNSGIVQFDASTVKGNNPASVTVTTLSYDTLPEHPEQMTVLPEDSHTRGTFPHFDRIGLIQYDTAMGNAFLRVDSAASGPWSDSMPGEYEDGWDAVGNKAVINNGNYGVMYRFAVHAKNSLHERRTASLFLNPSGGYGHFALLWNKQLFQSGFLSWENAWHVTDFKVNPNGAVFTSEISLTGGSSGPQVLYFTNQPK
ncbi:hypothetical protein [Cohnella nanjingensis]|uniref:Uncharacterized protein n=1 Tax=Cohnella nanjingensis TaxID=1387779 RepID=A0A7X0VF19_9BACL|nr:hypothetical protein [Cohnella nanjingensis]MBB6671605.1 hypothetical protein [Cohnella nanjingensis]